MSISSVLVLDQHCPDFRHPAEGQFKLSRFSLISAIGGQMPVWGNPVGGSGVLVEICPNEMCSRLFLGVAGEIIF